MKIQSFREIPSKIREFDKLYFKEFFFVILFDIYLFLQNCRTFTS